MRAVSRKGARAGVICVLYSAQMYTRSGCGCQAAVEIIRLIIRVGVLEARDASLAILLGPNTIGRIRRYLGAPPDSQRRILLAWGWFGDARMTFEKNSRAL